MNLQLLLSLLYVCVVADRKCSQQDVLNHLNLSTNQEHVAMTRPGQDSGTPTVVELDVVFSNIQGVDEKSQTFTPYMWIYMTWTNEALSWQPDQFCGIEEVSVPRELLWKPDLMILEMLEMERDKGTRQGSRHVQLSSNGRVTMTNYRKVTSDCAMDVFKFPFDSQSCTLTFTSYQYTDKELQLVSSSNSSPHDEVLFMGEWEVLNIRMLTEKTSYPGGTWDTVVYTISMRRVPLLYVLTFILPILFLLLLDVASFLMSDAQGQKTSFKVTVLLAMSVLLLVLKDTLPSKPRRTPLIAVYVMVTFGLMLLSLMESILVGYLIERADTQHKGDGGNRKCVGGIICVENGECQQEATPMTRRPDPAEGGEGGEGPHILDPVPLQGGEGGDPVPLQGGEGGDPVPLQGGDPVPRLLCLIHQDLQKLLLQNQNQEHPRNQNYHQNQNQEHPRNQNYHQNQNQEHPRNQNYHHNQNQEHPRNQNYHQKHPRNQNYHQNQNQEHPRNQNSLVRYINTTFFILYLLSISIFLPTLFINWVY